MWKRLCQTGFFVTTLSGMVSAMPAGWEKEDKKSELALQHPFLRAHFRKLYLVSNLTEPRSRPSRFSEMVVDKQITHFIEGVQTSLGDLSSSVEQLLLSRQQVLDHEKSEEAGTAEMRRLASEISERSDKLRKKIHLVLSNLQSKDSFTPRVNKTARNTLYGAETDYIERQAGEAERLIQNFFFSSSPTIHVGELKHFNMLILLYRVREMARELERQISNHP